MYKLMLKILSTMKYCYHLYIRLWLILLVQNINGLYSCRRKTIKPVPNARIIYMLNNLTELDLSIIMYSLLDRCERIEIIFVFSDYVGFVKRMLTLMHKGYKCFSRLEIELKQLEKTSIKHVHQGTIISKCYQLRYIYLNLL